MDLTPTFHPLLGLALGLLIAELSTLATTVYLHRGLTHRGLTVHPAAAIVLREGLGIMSAGIAFGLAAAAVAARTLESVLYGVTPSDPATYLLVPMLLASVALLAACAPTRRALRVQPNAVLRQE